jgi:membrane-associated phospholipid phosphatase
MVDTLSLFQRVNYHSAGAFVNPYAAMPSMHIAFNLLLCLAIASATSGMRTPFRVLGLAVSSVFPIVMATAVVVTGNHYILDIVGGYVVAALGMGAALAVREHGWRFWQWLPASA